jgi:hypothetical protein
MRILGAPAAPHANATDRRITMKRLIAFAAVMMRAGMSAQPGVPRRDAQVTGRPDP